MNDNSAERPSGIDEKTIQPPKQDLPNAHQPPHPGPGIDDPTQKIENIQKILGDIDPQNPKGSSKPKIGLYKGEQGGYLKRGIEAYEDEWNQDGMEKIKFNTLINSTVERAVLQGRRQIVVFDFGCGEGSAITEFLANNQSSAMKSIKEHPEIQVKFVGLTDTPGLTNATGTPEELAKGRQLKSTDDEPKNVSAQIDYYAVTAARTLEDYFVSHNIENIDVAMAVQSLPYLSAKNLESVIESITGRLQTPGSTFIAAPYATRVPGFAQAALFGAGSLDVRTAGKEPSLQSTLRNKGTRFYEPKLNIEEEERYLRAALEKCINLGAISQKEVNNRIDEVLPRRTRIMNRIKKREPQLEQIYGHKNPLVYLASVARLLYQAEQNLTVTRMKELKKQKKTVLTNLQSKYSNYDNIAFGERVIRITNTRDKSSNEDPLFPA